MVKKPPANAEVMRRVQSLGLEDPIEKEMATHSSILAWKIPRTEDPGGLQSMGLQRVVHNCAHAHTLTICSTYTDVGQRTVRKQLL